MHADRVKPRQTVRRRTFLGAVGGALAAAALAPQRLAAAEELSLTDLGGGFTLLTGAGGNVLARTSTAGLVVVDGGAAEYADALLAALGGLPGGDRVHTLFNTHWHTDQTGANAALGRRGAAIVAHAKTGARLAAGYYLPGGDRYVPPLPEAARPTHSFRTQAARTIGDVPVECGHLLLAHTDGDIYVRFADANLIAVGDVVSPARDPALDWFGGGWIGGRVEALGLLLDISDAQTRFVPSYGPVVGRDAVAAEHTLMLTLFERMVELIRQGISAGDALAAGVMDDLGRQFDEPLTFIDAAHRSLWAHHNKLSHDIV